MNVLMWQLEVRGVREVNTSTEGGDVWERPSETEKIVNKRAATTTTTTTGQIFTSF